MLMIHITHQAEPLDMSASSQMMQLAMLETIRVLRGEVEEDEVDLDDDGGQQESESEEEEEEDVAALYQRLNISRRMSLPASLTSLKHDDSQRRLQMLQRARGNFKEDDSQEEGEEEEGIGEPLMTGPQPMAMYAVSPPSDLDVGRRRRRGGATMPDVLSDESRSSISSSNPLPDLLPPQAPLAAALDCPDSSCSVLYHPTTSIGMNSDARLIQRVAPQNGWVSIGQGLNRLAGTTTDKGFLDQRRKSCLGSKLMTGEVSSNKKMMTRRRSVAGTGWMENRREMRSEQGGIFRDICAIVSIFGFYICVRKIESLLK